MSKRLKVNQSTISRLVSKFKATNSVSDLYRRPKPKISTPSDNRQLKRLVIKNRRASSTWLANEWKLSNGCVASPSTVRNKLREMRYKNKKKTKNL